MERRMALQLTDAEFQTVVALVRKKYGIDLSRKRVLIESRMEGALREAHISSFSEYLQELLRNPGGHREQELLNRLTTNYTFFMREQTHFDFITQKILPSVSLTSLASGYEIWCAGCSTGQECYTLAMHLEEYQRQGGCLPIYTIHATDISQRALAIAQKGEYNQRDIQNLPAEWLQRYWHEENGVYSASARLRRHIHFSHQNLMAPGVMLPEKYHLVLCRNVMIYFDEEARRTTRDLFYRVLKPKGYLLVGHTETLLSAQDKFDFILSAVYQKRVG